LVEDGRCIDLGRAEEAYRLAYPGSHWEVPADLKTFIAGGESNLQAARRLRDFALPAADLLLPLDQAKLHTPLPNPYMLAEMERNCEAQFAQSDAPRRTYPAMTILPDTVINDPGAPVILPTWSRRVTLSAQIAFVCGQRVAGVTETEAEEAIFGYTLLISFAEFGLIEMMQRPTERDRSINEDYGRWLDGFKPIGPWIITPDEAGPIIPRAIHLTVGGTQPVVTSTAALLNTPARILATLSSAIPFYPGDIIGLGAMGPDLVLPLAEHPSKRIEIVAEVGGIGRLECVVVAS
jgi:2-keto-4-pentenoate hydratase/2-oxohepta-3-ene-1,7-dioic acid hydratase in catechol pathway